MYELAGATVNVYGRFRSLGIAISIQLLLIAVNRWMLLVAAVPEVQGVPTYSTTEWSSCYYVILEFKILIEDGGVQLKFAVEAVAYPLPVRSRFGHVIKMP